MLRLRRKKLCSGKCDCCFNEANIPYKGGQYCYKCFNAIWYYVMEGENDKKEKEKDQEES